MIHCVLEAFSTAWTTLGFIWKEQAWAWQGVMSGHVPAVQANGELTNTEADNNNKHKWYNTVQTVKLWRKL